MPTTIIHNNDIIRCIKTLKIDGYTIIKKGVLYIAKHVKPFCCHPMIDIGIRHDTERACKCCCCGGSHAPSKNLFIPNHYFKRARQKDDALTRSIKTIEHSFSVINHRNRIALHSPIS